MTDPQVLINAYLDGVLSPEGDAELNAWVKENAENARIFAAAALLHDRLRNQAMAPEENVPAQPLHGPSRWRTVTALGAIAAVVAVMIGVWFSPLLSTSAASELERLINAPIATQDRTYQITSLDPAPAPLEERQAPIDGAKLYIRGPDKYVLVRRFPDGKIYITGSDGERNWAAPPDGAVRLSRDPFRFRWPLPGHQQRIPFIDLRSDLVELREAYDVRILPPGDNGWHVLDARRKSALHRGPEEVKLWYDAKTLVIHRMVFAGISQVRGGPRSVAVELIAQGNLGPEFFEHQTHHAADRRVIEED